MQLKLLLTPLSCIATILLLDFLWLGFIASNLYKTELGDLLKSNPLSSSAGLISALIVYLAITIGIHFFVLPTSTIAMAFLRGALFGLTTYAIYDFTNLCTLNGWSLKISLADTLWGGFLCGMASLVTHFVSQKLS